MGGVWRGCDGYPLSLPDPVVTLTLFFHNKHPLEDPNGTALEPFLLGIDAVAVSSSPMKP
ncbi:DUF3081 family protein [Ferrimonas futtsuensis]|uniref:DUF3081 family protein n=1 Tax=Ferrimonas futtsuensis TaxID=364764 RepID=UPI00041848D4|nr:DUF3081 family protein [Ferrimonas futtsuensis]